MDASRRMYCPARGRQISLDSDAGDGAALGSDFETGRDLAGDPQTARDRICVALIEDSCLAREGITALLGGFSDFEVVAADSDDYATVLAETAPDVVLLNFGLGNGDTLEIVRTLRTGYPGLRVLLMDLLPAHEDLVDFIAAGVCGFVPKDASPAQLVLTIRSLATGLDVLPDPTTSSLYSEIAREAVAPGRVVDSDSARLTPRELEVIALVAEGLSNKAISRRLHISIHTVKSHLRNVMDKLTLHSRLQIARYVHERAARAQLPTPGPAARRVPPPSLDRPPGRLIGRTASRSGTDAPGRHSRPGAGRRAFGSRDGRRACPAWTTVLR